MIWRSSIVRQICYRSSRSQIETCFENTKYKNLNSHGSQIPHISRLLKCWQNSPKPKLSWGIAFMWFHCWRQRTRAKPTKLVFLHCVLSNVPSNNLIYQASPLCAFKRSAYQDGDSKSNQTGLTKTNHIGATVSVQYGTSCFSIHTICNRFLF